MFLFRIFKSEFSCEYNKPRSKVNITKFLMNRTLRGVPSGASPGEREGWGRGGGGENFPPARRKRVQFALNIKHALFGPML